MVTRGTTFYGFTELPSFSVFSCETHLTWRLSLSQRNSLDKWKVRDAKIRISISLDTPLSWVSPEILIGTTLTLTRNNNQNQWCDYCKLRYGSNKGVWHPLAQTPAVWVCISESPKRKGITRFYCQKCADAVQNWSDGTFYLLKQQLEDAITHFARQEQLDVELP
jgi:hypothetical protein